MKVCVIQPKYSFNESDLQSCFDGLISLLDKCDDSLDIIVTPEYSDALSDVKGKKGYYDAVTTNSGKLLDKAKKTAKRCNSLVFVNAGYQTENGIRNTTYAIDKNGEIIGKYFKAHPAPSEVKTDAEGGHELDVDYSYDFNEPYTLEIEGLKFAFLTCYDFYFYENFARIAKENVDVIIGCSLQRTDTHEALEIINKFLCYNTNAYLIRSSVSLGEDSKLCGSSMVVSPKGEMLLNMKSKVGLGVCKINPKDKYYKPAGFMGKLKSHYEYIEEGRRPWLYRNAGASVVHPDNLMKYPRICAHRGFNTVAPENSMPSFASAISLGAQEIEFDIWASKDGEIVLCHDENLERVSNGTGKIYEKTLAELKQFDFGVKYGEKFKGLKICTLKEVLQKFAGSVIMNIHVKIWDKNFDNLYIEKIVSLIRKYDAEKHVYFMTNCDDVIKKVIAYAPDINVCVGFDGHLQDPLDIVKRAIKLGAKKVQLYRPYFTQETVDFAHQNGILCNLFYADEPELAKEYLKMGIDTILTNDYLTIKNILNI